MITVDAVTDRQGNVQCAQTSKGYNNDVFSGINSNAEAYFGGWDIDQYTYVPTGTSFSTTTKTITYALPSERTTTMTSTGSVVEYETIYLDANNEPANTRNLPTGTMIALETPFVYQPERGAEGADGSPEFCLQGPDKEAYGYVPQRVLDYLVENQNPELWSCLPGGPSIIQAPSCTELAQFSTTFQQVASDLTSSVTIYVGKPIVPTPEPIAPPKTVPEQKNDPVPIPIPVTNPPITQPNPNPPQPTGPGRVVPSPSPNPPNPSVNDPIQPFTVPQPPPSPTPVQPPTDRENSIGAIINSIFGNPPPPVIPVQNPPQPNPNPGPAAPVIIPAATTIPIAQAPPGAVGSSANIGGTPVIIILGPTTIAQGQGQGQAPAGQGQQQQAQPAPQPIIIPAATTIPAANAPPGAVGSVINIDNTPFLVIPAATTIQQAPGGGGGNVFPTSVIDGSTVLVIPGPTSIPLVNAPAGLTGETTTINGTPFLIVPGPTNIPLPAPSPGTAGQGQGANTFPTTIIDGSTLLAIPGPTSIPLANAPAGLTGETRMINGTPFLVIPSPTTVPAPPGNANTGSEGLFITTTLNNTPFLLIPGPTSIPLSLAPPGLQGSTTTLNGTPFLVIPASTTLQDRPVVPGTTVISGTDNLVILGPTTVPIDSRLSVEGSTTVVGGATMVVVSGATTVPVRTSSRSSGMTSSSRMSSSLGSSTQTSAGRTSTSSAGAAPTGVWIGGLGVLAGGVVMAVL